MISSPSKSLSPDEADAFGRELDALRDRVRADLGTRDVEHIRRIIRLVHYSEAGGRAALQLGLGPVTFALGVSALAASKILENMEVGHNVMHGQYDWTGDPALDAKAYEWDLVADSELWRHSHNYEHHTFTNILGRDRDVGYMFLRIHPLQRWRPLHLFQPAAAAVLALLFQWGVALHELHLDETFTGRQPFAVLRRRAAPVLRKASWQLAKDYLVFPALAGWNAPRVALGNLLANGIRNLWTFAIIFCGHFPDGARVYREDEIGDERRGDWYLRQLNGSANISGSRALHVLSGHLSHQIEHHLFPDLPAARYPELAPHVRAICERYGQAYNTGGFAAQLGSVARAIVRNALPNPRAQRVGTVRRAGRGRKAAATWTRAATAVVARAPGRASSLVTGGMKWCRPARVGSERTPPNDDHATVSVRVATRSR